MGLIAVDWGSSNCRAYLLKDGRVVARRETRRGIKALTHDQFSREFDALVADWSGQAEAAVLFGMVTSKNGWVETPYVQCPSTLSDLTAAMVSRPHGRLMLHFLPGLSQTSPYPDVLRGEEMQLFGLDPTPIEQIVVLPGTHSKWCVVKNGSVRSFRTIITGEMFQILLDHSLAGQLATSATMVEDVFGAAVRRGFQSDTIIADIFSARSSVLLGSLDDEHVHCFLSGLMIGRELREGLTLTQNSEPDLLFVGNPELAKHYGMACDALRIPRTSRDATTSLKAVNQMDQGSLEDVGPL